MGRFMPFAYMLLSVIDRGLRRTGFGHEGTLDMRAIQYVQWRIASGKRSSAGCGVLLGYGVSTPTSGESLRDLKWPLPSHAMTCRHDRNWTA